MRATTIDVMDAYDNLEEVARGCGRICLCLMGDPSDGDGSVAALAVVCNALEDAVARLRAVKGKVGAGQPAA